MNELISSKKFKVLSIVYLVVLYLLFALSHVDSISAWFTQINEVISPVLLGFVMAYFINPFFRFFENIVFATCKPRKLRRILSLIFTYILIFLILSLLFLAIFPQLIDNVRSFLNGYEEAFRSLIDYINGIIQKINTKIDPEQPDIPIRFLDYDDLVDNIGKFLNSIDVDLETVKSFLSSATFSTLLSHFGTTFTVLKDLLFGFFISLYVLTSKEKRYAQIKRFRKAFFSDATDDLFMNIVNTANRNFGIYFKGKIVDAFLIGIIFYCFLLLFGFDYPLLLASILFIGNLIPILGPIVTITLTASLSLLSNPDKIITYLIVVILLQILNSYFIAPKVLGTNNGIGFLLVFVSILVMMKLFGFVGIVVGIPIFATISELLGNWLYPNHRKKERKDYFTKLSNRYREDRNKRQTGMSVMEKIRWNTYNIVKKYHLYSDSNAEETAVDASKSSEQAVTTNENTADLKSTENTEVKENGIQ